MKGLEQESDMVRSVFYDVNSARSVKGGLKIRNWRQGVQLCKLDRVYKAKK